MKKFLLIIFIASSAICTEVRAQMAIGTMNPAPTAILDLSSTSQGMLVPRMSTVQRLNITSPAIGLLVYDSTLGKFYYPNGGYNWKSLMPGGTLTNSIVDADSNTRVETDLANDNKVHFTLGGTEYFTMNRGTLETSNNGGSTYLGYAAGSNDSYNATLYNVGLGRQALQNGNGGLANVAAGWQALQNLTGGSYNVAIGAAAGQSVTNGDNNTLLGYAAGQTGNGANNAYVGYSAGAQSGGSNNVFLGYRAGQAETGSNRLYIANSNTSTPLLWGDFSGKKLRVNDSLGAKYFGLSNGAATGYILRSDAAGNASWVAPATVTGTSGLTANYLSKWNGTAFTNALLYEQNNRLSIGTTSPNSFGADLNFSKFTIASGSSDTSDLNMVSASPAAGSAWLNFGKARGSLAAPAIVQLGDDLGYIGADGYDGSTYLQSGFLGFSVAGTPSSGKLPTDFSITTMDTSGSQDLRIYVNAYGNVGIGGSTLSSEKLEVAGNIRATDTLKSNRLRLSGGAANGYLLRSDAAGNASWASTASLTTNTLSLGGTTLTSTVNGVAAGVNLTSAVNSAETDPQVSSAVSGRVPRWANTTLTDGSIYDDGVNIGIGNTSPAQKLDVSGTTRTTNLQLMGGAANGYILRSDASGNAAWTNPLSIRTDTLTLIADSDANTKVVTGPTNADDKIHFILGGTERFTMNRGTLEWNNTAGSIYLGNSAGLNDNYSGATYNIGIGSNALQATGGSATRNVAIGRQAMQQATGGTDNAMVGTGAGRLGTSASYNSALGSNALDGNISGANNVAIGYYTGLSATGDNNTFLGTFAGSNCTGNRNVFVGYGAGYSEAGNDKLYIANTSTTTPLVYGDFSSNYLKINGKLGVGVTPTKAQFEVSGAVSMSLSYAYFNGSNNTGFGSGTQPYSIYASDRIAAVEFNAFSDARIKHIISRSNGASDLATLMQLRITDYRHIDTIEHGNSISKKVIAQEVEAVYPIAVKQTVNEIPDIYKLATIKNGVVRVANNLKRGEKIKLIFGARIELAEVLEADARSFRVMLPDEGQVFVYGRQVSDFRTVDYEALTTLNISATQELLRQVEALKEENKSLSAAQETAKRQLDELRADLDTVKAALGINVTVTARAQASSNR